MMNICGTQQTFQRQQHIIMYTYNAGWISTNPLGGCTQPFVLIPEPLKNRSLRNGQHRMFWKEMIWFCFLKEPQMRKFRIKRKEKRLCYPFRNLLSFCPRVLWSSIPKVRAFSMSCKDKGNKLDLLPQTLWHRSPQLKQLEHITETDASPAPPEHLDSEFQKHLRLLKISHSQNLASVFH